MSSLDGERQARCWFWFVVMVVQPMFCPLRNRFINFSFGPTLKVFDDTVEGLTDSLVDVHHSRDVSRSATPCKAPCGS